MLKRRQVDKWSVEHGEETTMAKTHEMTDAFVTASRALIGLAVRTIGDAPVEVTVAQHRVLVLLASRGELTIGDIAVGLAVNPSNATRYCDRLQRLGLVERSRSPADGRVVQVILTELGRSLVRTVNDRRRAEVDKVLARMTNSETAGVLAALHAFNRAADEFEDRDWASSLW
jgi:DNA-binding MarR family transcriptional regulator